MDFDGFESGDADDADDWYICYTTVSYTIQ